MYLIKKNKKIYVSKNEVMCFVIFISQQNIANVYIFITFFILTKKKSICILKCDIV